MDRQTFVAISLCSPVLGRQTAEPPLYIKGVIETSCFWFPVSEAGDWILVDSHLLFTPIIIIISRPLK